MSVELGNTTWTAVAPARPLLLVPVGSCEQHGPHLPLATDTILAEHLCYQIPNVLVSPSITIGASGEHAGFPGTLSIGNEALTRVLIEIGRSADWCSGIIFVNGHGGNTRAVSLATSALVAESRRVAAWAPRMDGDAHAGRIETSMMLAIAPHLVNMAAAESGNMQPLSEIMNDIQLGGVISVSNTGVLGDPRTASRDTGERLVTGLVTELATFVELRRREWA